MPKVGNIKVVIKSHKACYFTIHLLRLQQICSEEKNYGGHPKANLRHH